MSKIVTALMWCIKLFPVVIELINECKELKDEKSQKTDV